MTEANLGAITWNPARGYFVTLNGGAEQGPFATQLEAMDAVPRPVVWQPQRTAQANLDVRAPRPRKLIRIVRKGAKA